MLAASTAPLCQEYDAGLLDLDGVLYVGDAAVPHAADAVRRARERGLQVAFVTNNASRRPDVVAEHLCALGVPSSAEDVVTSAQAAARRLARDLPPGSAVLVLGTQALVEEVAAVGLRPVRSVGQAGPRGPAAVVQGLDPATGWADLAEACVAVRAGALWVAGNTDSTYPSERGPLPGNGALVAALAAATGATPVVVGKPFPELHRISVERVGASRPLVVGDRLDTDVLGAVRAGSDSLLVLTGVTGRAELLRAPVDHRPTYVSSDLRGLLLAHPASWLDGEVARCGSAWARYDGDRLTVGDAQDLSAGRVLADHPASGPDADDALRAACLLAWARTDAG